MILIFFTRSLPLSIADELSSQGHHVFESLSISETLLLAEQHPEAAIVINHDIDQVRANLVQKHHPTLVLNETTTASELLWEVVQLFLKDTPFQ